EANLLTPDEVREAAVSARERGATAVMINCTPVSRTLAYVEALSDCGLPFGAYGNAGEAEEGFGWRAHPSEPSAYADVAQTWVDAGATILGACCGTGPGHVAALSERFASPS
ncbi:MAG: homocysteine S-methyltransferase family protein, partial [Planctomycetota bacterium]